MSYLFFVDYDDTLLCSDLLYSEAKNQKIEVLNMIINPKLNVKLKKLENKIIEFLQYLKLKGDVIILTNATTSWVYNSSLKFMPKVNNFLKEIKVVSAYEKYKEKNPNLTDENIYHWKLHTFSSIINKIKNKNLNIISIGDSDYERYAVEVLNDEMQLKKNLNIKSIQNIKFIENPNITKIIIQLNMINLNLNYFLKSDEVFTKFIC
jgi:hypothetical protein